MEESVVLFKTWLLEKPACLRAALEKFAFGGVPGAGVRLTPYYRVNGYSGYDYVAGLDECGRVGFAPLQFGGFVIRKEYTFQDRHEEVFERFSQQGELLGADPVLYLNILYVNLTQMEPACPILSHLYNYLAYEYEQAAQGNARSSQINLIETFLKDLLTRFSKVLSVGASYRDAALVALHVAAVEEENNPVLSWDERQKNIAVILAERNQIARTKRRVHGLRWRDYTLRIAVADLCNFFRRVSLRPRDNFKGFLYRYTIGVMIWFFKTVKGNIGYSIALAIYGPFTFYFITQPLNPHAMWAVGRVRSAYIDTISQVSAAVSELEERPAKEASSRVVTPVEVQDPIKNFPISTDITAEAHQTWPERMSRFKDMQIGYEENLIFAARMGRLEQMETQLAFPLGADSAWKEIERYCRSLDEITDQKGFTLFFKNEKTACQTLQLYVWDRLFRHLLDHPYVVMDESQEQVYRDYYTAKAFVIFNEMTLALVDSYPRLTKTPQYKKIAAIAAELKKKRIVGGTILDRLKKNSALFSQSDRFDGRELRRTMARQWEVLYLQQNKAQEAANFGMMTYTDSVRNTLWLLQSLYSVKRHELTLLFEPGRRSRSKVHKEIRTRIEPQIESIFYLLNMESVSLRVEFSERLANDIEFIQRREIIRLMEEWLVEREKVLRTMLIPGAAD